MSIKNVVVVGGGVLGSQIAYQTAYAGFHTTIYLRSEASIQRARPKVDRLHAIYVAELTAAKANPGGPVSRGLVFNAADTAAVSATSSRPSIRRFLSSRFFICFPPFP